MRMLWLCLALVFCLMPSGAQDVNPILEHGKNRATARLVSREIPYAKRLEEQEFKIDVFFRGEQTVAMEKLSVELTFNAGKVASPVYKASLLGGSNWTVRAIPVFQNTVRVTVVSENGNVSTQIPDREIQIGQQKVKLSELQSLSRFSKGNPQIFKVVLLKGTSLMGAVKGWDGFDVNIGGMPAHLNLANLNTVQLENVHNDLNDVRPPSYHISIKYLDTLLGEVSGEMRYSDAPPPTCRAQSPLAAGASTGGFGYTPPPPSAATSSQTTAPTPLADANATSVTLPAPVSNLAVGGGGRYLFLTLKSLRKLAVFDTTTTKIIRYLPLVSDDVRVAAGADKLVMVSPVANTIERYSLRTFERELTVPRPDVGPIRDVALGYASNGPLMILLSNPTQTSGPGLYDLNTLRKLDKDWKGIGNAWNDQGMFYFLHARASPDGQVFTQWHSPFDYYGPDVLRITEKGAEGAKFQEGAGYSIPGNNGQFMFTEHGLFNYDLKYLGPTAGTNLIPTYSDAYYLSVQSLHPQRDVETVQLSVYSTADKRLLLTLPNFNELIPPRTGPFGFSYTNNEDQLTLEKRVHFYPTANLLITVPYTNDQLVVRHIDIVKEMEKAGIDYLFVASVPPTTARKGQPYTYQVDAKSRRGNLKLTLESGPPGMTLSPKGKLTWNVPTNFNSTEENIILRLHDDSGQEVFHTFKISVLPQP